MEINKDNIINLIEDCISLDRTDENSYSKQMFTYFKKIWKNSDIFYLTYFMNKLCSQD